MERKGQRSSAWLACAGAGANCVQVCNGLVGAECQVSHVRCLGAWMGLGCRKRTKTVTMRYMFRCAHQRTSNFRPQRTVLMLAQWY